MAEPESDPFDVTQAKNSRKTQRSKVTRALRNVEKLLSDDVKELRPLELQRKLDIINSFIQDEIKAQDHLIKAMTVKKASEAEIQKEIDGHTDREIEYDDHLDKIRESITMGNLLLQYQEVITKTDAWLDYGAPSSTGFVETGEKLVKELDGFIREFAPYSTHTDLGPLLPKARELSRKVSINLNKKAPTTATPAAGSPSATARRPATYQIQAPTFSGKPIDFQTFFDRFSEVLKNHWDAYSDGDRCCILADAMLDPGAKELVQSYSSAGYDIALAKLKERYGRAAAVYPTYVEELVARGHYEYSQDSMMAIIRRVEHTLDAMEKLKGKSIGQLAVALVVRDFDNELAKEWAKHLGSSDTIPDAKQLLDFVKPLSHTLPSKSKSSQSYNQTSSKSTYPKKDDKKAATSTSPAATKSCSLCKGPNHFLARCQVFMDADVSKRWNLVRHNKYCVNCLHQSHTVANCSSTYSCRTCQAKHHTLLHRGEETDKKVKQPGTALLTTAKTTSDSEPRLLPSGFIHTAIMTVYKDDRWMTVRAAVDTCCSSSVMSERVASHLKVDRLPINIEMAGAVSTMALSQSAMVGIRPAFTSSDRVELEAAIMPRSLASTPPDNKEDVAKHLKLRDVRLADEDLGGPIDFILGAAAHKHIFQEKAIRNCDDLDVIAIHSLSGSTPVLCVLSTIAELPLLTELCLLLSLQENLPLPGRLSSLSNSMTLTQNCSSGLD